ncbi:MAG: hypothetical protein JW828_08425 [Sedimentisphaerales bacterium]|nr:hypothetical protein [Sedimentisphaerales bacterium]
MTFRKNILWLSLAVIASLAAVVMIPLYGKRSRFKMKDKELPRLENIPADVWKQLADRTIFFAHMSVGYNILDSVKDITAANPQIEITPAEVPQGKQIQGPVLAHAMLGHNAQPRAKIDSFREWMKKIAPSRPDIALMKFCYVDIRHDTDIEALFTEYRGLMEEVRAAYPDTVFMHATVPLCSGPVPVKKQIKEAVKTLIGKPATADDNRRREQFNDLLRKAYGGKEPLFDIAEAESTTSDNKRCYVRHKGQEVPMMVKAYTTDGGHLNEQGRRIAAEQLLSAGQGAFHALNDPSRLSGFDTDAHPMCRNGP